MLWEKKLPVDRVFELRCKTTDYFGVGAIEKINDILDVLKRSGIDSVLLVTGKSSYKRCGAWDHIKPALESKGFKYALYDKVSANPTVDMVDEAKELGLEIGAGAVIGIGGGSPIDTAKSVAILLEYKDKTARDLYTLSFNPEKAKPVIAVNITHGTGTEVNRFAVATIPEKNYKPAIALDCIYPLFSIDDPALTKTLPAKQTLYVTVDALNHVTEAATTKVASPFSINLAIETARLIFEYLPQALISPDDLKARYYLLYASAIAGISFDNALLHYTHALEHPLSAVKPDLPHGLGLGMLLPAVVKNIYPYVPEILSAMYKPIVPEAKGVPGEAEMVAKKIEEWLASMGLKEKLTDVGFKEDDIPTLVKLAFETPVLEDLINLAPVPEPKEFVERIYRESLEPMA